MPHDTSVGPRCRLCTDGAAPYLVMDFRDVTPDGVASLLAEARALLGGVPPDRVLSFSEGAEVDPPWLKTLKDLFVRPTAGGGTRVAVVGAGRAHQAVMAAMNFRAGEERILAFDDEPSALEWLLGG